MWVKLYHYMVSDDFVQNVVFNIFHWKNEGLEMWEQGLFCTEIYV